MLSSAGVHAIGDGPWSYGSMLRAITLGEQGHGPKAGALKRRLPPINGGGSAILQEFRRDSPGWMPRDDMLMIMPEIHHYNAERRAEV